MMSSKYHIPVQVCLTIIRGMFAADTLEVEVQLVQAPIGVSSQHGQVVVGLTSVRVEDRGQLVISGGGGCGDHGGGGEVGLEIPGQVAQPHQAPEHGARDPGRVQRLLGNGVKDWGLLDRGL